MEGVGCRPHPTPSTLHPTPYTLHPTPYTCEELKESRRGALTAAPPTTSPPGTRHSHLYPETDLPVPRWAYLSRGGPICPEAGLSHAAFRGWCRRWCPAKDSRLSGIISSTLV